MTILCCGDRAWNNVTVIENVLLQYKGQDITLVHGNCRGADKICAFQGLKLGFKILSFPANWFLHGKAAGPIRNRQMLDENKIDLVLAFHNYINNSSGTKDMLKQAKNRNIPTKLFTE